MGEEKQKIGRRSSVIPRSPSLPTSLPENAALRHSVSFELDEVKSPISPTGDEVVQEDLASFSSLSIVEENAEEVDQSGLTESVSSYGQALEKLGALKRSNNLGKGLLQQELDEKKNENNRSTSVNSVESVKSEGSEILETWTSNCNKLTIEVPEVPEQPATHDQSEGEESPKTPLPGAGGS